MGWIVPTTKLFTIETGDTVFDDCQFIQVNNGVVMFDYRLQGRAIRRQVRLEDIASITFEPPMEEVKDDGSYIELSADGEKVE